jgi:hypothetical protein
MSVQAERLQLNEFDVISLARPVECEGRLIQPGTLGTVLDVSPSGLRFEIEFFQPFHCVATVWIEDIASKVSDPPR